MCKELFLCTFGLKEWAVWNWMLRKKSENHLYSHTSPHYGRAAPSAPPPPPPPPQKKKKCSRLIHKNMSIATRETKLKLQIPVKELPLCEYLLVTALDLQAVLLSLSSNSASLCYETKLCCHNFIIYDLSPPPPPHTHTKLNTLDFGMKTMADLRQMNLPPMCNIT